MASGEYSLDDHNSMASGEYSLDDHNSMASREDSLDDHNSMASREDSLDDHNSMASREDSLDDHNSMASGEDSPDDHTSMASGEDSLDDHNSMASGEESLDDNNSITSGEDSLDDHNSMASGEDISTYFTGTHEVQECLEGQGEVDLHTHLANCEKNPGHTNFVPVNQLSAEHFPSGYHDNDVYDLTKAIADLTVRIAVKLTSPDRPEFVPGSKDPYPCYNTRGQNSLRTGTGRVWGVIKYTEEMDPTFETYRTCPCPECDHSDTPSKVWWEVLVVTAKHVIFDESEAVQSSCRLWFDDDKSPVVNIDGWKVDRLSNTEGDWCWLYCATHDVDVGDKLEEMVRHFDGLCEKVKDKYKSRRDVDKLTIIVSHPHGCSKQVSVGHWVHRQVDDQNKGGELTRYTYTTSTCPGSSGATVYTLGWYWGSGHTHSGVSSGGLNYSGVWYD